MKHIGDGVGHQGHQAVLGDGADQDDARAVQDVPEILSLQHGADTEHRQGEHTIHRPAIEGSEGAGQKYAVRPPSPSSTATPVIHRQNR